MGNIPLQTGGQFINPAQKSGVSQNWNTQQYEYAKSIVESFNAMGQQIGSDLVRVGKSFSQDAEQEAVQNDAHSISMLKIRQGEDFSVVEKTIAAKEYKTVEEFDADWATNILPQLDEAHEAVMQDADIVWNRQRIQPQAQRVYELAREQFRVKARAGVDARVTQRRQTNAAQAISSAGASANFDAISAGRDAAIASGIPVEQVEELTRGAMFEAFNVTQRTAMEQHGGVNSAGYKIAMHNALSGQRDAIADKIRVILNAEDDKILDAWKASDFTALLDVPKKGKSKSVSVSGKKTAGTEKAEKRETEFKLGADWEAVKEAGLKATEEVCDAELKEIEDAVNQGIITQEQATRFKEDVYTLKSEKEAEVYADILAQRTASEKESRELVKSLISTAATDEEAFLRHCTAVQYAGNTATILNEKLNWMRERKDSEYDANKSRAALLRIYANAGRFKDEEDPDGSYRLSALALARKNCNAADYAKAISFLAGGEKDSASQKLIEQGMARLFDAADVKADDIKGTDEDGWIAAYCDQVAQLAGNLPPASFRHEIESLCDGLKKEKDERARIHYLETYIESATRDIEDFAKQFSKQFELTAPADDAGRDRAEQAVEAEEKKKKAKEAEAKSKAADDEKRAKKFAPRVPPVGMPGMLPL